MRIQRLDLLRYGHFTDTHIEFPAGSADFHIVFGPNEAGKSTALSAIEDLLFGIGGNSPYNFLHDYGSMRVGAVLQSGGKTLELKRRKGNKDTLLTADDLPLVGGTGALAPFLGGVDKPFFERMFSLDHERLRKGGREILEAKDEVGQTLFAAGAGLPGLRDRLKALNVEAEGLWSSRKAAHRKYYQAADRLELAEKALREHTITAAKWGEIKRAYDDAQEAYDALEKQIEGISIERRKLSRIRRVCRDIRKLTQLKEEISSLDGVVSLPKDARSQFDAAERDHDSATARVEAFNEQLLSEQVQRDALTYNAELLLRDDDIQQFHKRRIEIQKEKVDLPHRQAELTTAENNLRRLAEELEWDASIIENVAKKIPPRPKVAVIRTLLNARGERASSVGNAKLAVDEVENQIADLELELKGMGALVDVSKLAAVVKATRESGDVASRIKAVEGEIREATAAIRRRLKTFEPQVVENALGSMSVPSRDMVQNHRDAARGADQKIETCRERIRNAEQELGKHRKAYERLARDEDAVAPKDVADARHARDVGWSLIRRRYVDSVAVGDPEVEAFTAAKADLPEAYEAAIEIADGLADRRFDHASAAAEIAITSRQVAEQEELLAALHDEEKKLAAAQQALETSWKEMWLKAPFDPLAPDVMLEWLTNRNETLDAIERRGSAERQLEALRSEETEAKARILAELLAVLASDPALGDQPLRVVMEAAAAIQGRHESDAVTRRQSEDRLRRLNTEADRKRKALRTAEDAWSSWETEWGSAIMNLGLGASTTPEAVSAQLDNIDRMREISVEINQLRHDRIEKIERDIETFAHDVKTLVAAVAGDLADVDPEEGVITLERRLEEAKRTKEQVKAKESAIATLQKKIADCESAARDSREVIRRLTEAARASDIEQLKAAIENSDKLRLLESEHVRIVTALAEESDGLSLDDLGKECDGVDLDKTAAREQTLDEELKELRARLMEFAERRSQSRNAFDAIGGDARASDAAALKQSALAEMRDIAVQYVRVRSAATLLHWAIDRYRKEKQGPLLKRAGEIFATLTGGSFSDLTLQFDDNDNAQLAGLRSIGGSVHVGGMSTGTADQLYLALRVASIEDYLSRADALPFVADDLFINFDDERAGAGFRVLGQLAQKTQILFFTHHQHLVDIAQNVLGKSVTVTSLVEPPVASAA